MPFGFGSKKGGVGKGGGINTIAEEEEPSVSIPKDVPCDAEWLVGGRYDILSTVQVWENPSLSGEIVATLKPKDIMLLVAIKSSQSPTCGLVIPPTPGQPGWVELPASSNEINKRRRKDSWEMKARYAVNHPTTLRTGPSLASAYAGELEPDMEVLVLDLSFHNSGDGTQVRLRAQVQVCSDKNPMIGWVSPETSHGDRLLQPVNLLGPEVVEMHRQSIMAEKGEVAGSVRCSIRPGFSDVPWEVGGRYRVLETLTLHRDADLKGAQLGKVSAASLVSIREVRKAPCRALEQCPCAFVTVDAGPETGGQGWIRLSAEDGHDIVDTRDQLEYEKVIKRLSQVHTDQSPIQHPPRAENREHSNSSEADGTGTESTDSTQSDSDAEEQAPEEKEKEKAKVEPKENREKNKLKLQELEVGGKEEKVIDEAPVIQEDSYSSCISCSCTKRATHPCLQSGTRVIN